MTHSFINASCSWWILEAKSDAWDEFWIRCFVVRYSLASSAISSAWVCWTLKTEALLNFKHSKIYFNYKLYHQILSVNSRSKYSKIFQNQAYQTKWILKVAANYLSQMSHLNNFFPSWTVLEAISSSVFFWFKFLSFCHNQYLRIFFHS